MAATSVAQTIQHDLGTLLGARTDSIGWTQVFVFLAALILSSLVVAVMLLFEGFGLPPLQQWLLRSLLSSAALTTAAVGTFRWLENPVVAAALAGFSYAVVMLSFRLFLMTVPEGGQPFSVEPSSFLYGFLFRFLYGFLFLLALALALRWLKPVWVALGVGAVLGTLLFDFAVTPLELVMGRDASFSQSWLDWVVKVADPLAFAAFFFIGLRLFPPPAGVPRAQRAVVPSVPSEEQAVKRLFAIYQKHPQGFVQGQGGPPEEEIRRIGQTLYDEGGMDLMRRVHAQFASECPIYGAPRNLEFMWHGVGAWLG